MENTKHIAVATYYVNKISNRGYMNYQFDGDLTPTKYEHIIQKIREKVASVSGCELEDVDAILLNCIELKGSE